MSCNWKGGNLQSVKTRPFRSPPRVLVLSAVGVVTKVVGLYIRFGPFGFAFGVAWQYPTRIACYTPDLQSNQNALHLPRRLMHERLVALLVNCLEKLFQNL